MSVLHVEFKHLMSGLYIVVDSVVFMVANVILCADLFC